MDQPWLARQPAQRPPRAWRSRSRRARDERSKLWRIVRQRMPETSAFRCRFPRPMIGAGRADHEKRKITWGWVSRTVVLCSSWRDRMRKLVAVASMLVVALGAQAQTPNGTWHEFNPPLVANRPTLI